VETIASAVSLIMSVGLKKETIPREIEGDRIGKNICGEAVRKLYRSFYI